MGVDIGRKLKAQAIDLDGDLLSRGIKDALAGKSALSDADMRSAMMAFQQELAAKQTDKNKKEGEDFLAANKKKPGVVTTQSGLQYQVIKEGTGKTPKVTDTVTANYEGTLIDGTVFDSSYKRGQPLSIPVNGVIKGWTEALQLDEGRLEVEAVHPLRAGLRRQPPPGRPDRAERRADLRPRAARREVS